jgi:hypothetical protein
MPHPDLTDEEKLALAAELKRAIAEDRYPLSLRIRTLQGILVKIEPRPAREPLPARKHYEPPRTGRWPMATPGIADSAAQLQNGDLERQTVPADPDLLSRSLS